MAQTSDLAQQEEEEEEEKGRLTWDSKGGEEIEASGSEEDGDEGEGSDYSEPPEEAKLFVGNLSYDIDSEKLAQLFDQAGVVEIAEVKFLFI